MNTDDLRRVLTDRADEAGVGPTTDARLAEIRGKAGAIRARRLAGVGGAVAVVAAIVVSSLLSFDVNADRPEPAESVEPWQDLQLQEYAHGGKLIDEAVVDLVKKTASMTVPSDAFPITIVTECSRHLRMAVTGEDKDTGPHLVIGGECGEYEVVERVTSGTPGDEPRVGHGGPVTLTVTLEAAMDESGEGYLSKIPGDSGVAVGVYEGVPWEDYEFPNRPDELLQLEEVMGDGPIDGMVVESADDPNEPVTVQFTGDGVSLDVRSQTPGRMKILIDGVRVDTAMFWDYGRGHQYVTPWGGGREGLLPDEGVEITFVPQDFTGAWRANLQRCELNSDGTFGCGP